MYPSESKIPGKRKHLWTSYFLEVAFVVPRYMGRIRSRKINFTQKGLENVKGFFKEVKYCTWKNESMTLNRVIGRSCKGLETLKGDFLRVLWCYDVPFKSSGEEGLGVGVRGGERRSGEGW